MTSKSKFSLSNIINKSRQYFSKQGFDEVVTPILNRSLPLEQNIYSFKVTKPGSKDKYYLPTSPEFALKKHLATHQNNCFSISPCFRNLESLSPHHLPEFHMIEWYEVGKNYQDIMFSVQKYVSKLLNLKFLNYVLPSDLPDNEPDFNQYFLNEIEPNLPMGGVFVTGYPSFLAPMAKPGERFELYIDQVEIANGNSESLDSKSILHAFRHEQEHRLATNLPTHPIDMDFVEAIAKIPPCAGVGLGLDRLVMILNHSHSIL